MTTILVTEDHEESTVADSGLPVDKCVRWRVRIGDASEGTSRSNDSGHDDAGMGGIEVLRLVRSRPSTAAMPVIAYTGIADQAFQEHARREGATDFCVKGSVDFEQLPALIGKYV